VLQYLCDWFFKIVAAGGARALITHILNDMQHYNNNIYQFLICTFEQRIYLSASWYCYDTVANSPVE